MSVSIESQPVLLEDGHDLRLAQGAEVIVGLNGIPMLYIATTRKYVRLSALGASVVELLRCGTSRNALIHALKQQCGANGSSLNIEHATNHFLTQLTRMGAVESDGIGASSEMPPGRLRNVLRHFKPQSNVRLALWHPDRPLGRPLIRLFGMLRWQLGDGARSLISLAILSAIAFVAYSVVQAGRSFDLTQVALPAVIAAFLLHLCLHESAHVLVCAHYGVKIREIGVGLLDHMIPMAYVDRTDSYRLAHREAQAHIAVAGPAFDLFGACVTSTVLLVAQGSVRTTAQALLFLQAASFLSNINLLLPTDGYHVLEAVLGEINLRRRAFTFVTHKTFNRKLPPFLANLSRMTKTVYVMYGIAALLYFVLLVGFMSLFFFRVGMSAISSFAQLAS